MDDKINLNSIVEQCELSVFQNPQENFPYHIQTRFKNYLQCVKKSEAYISSILERNQIPSKIPLEIVCKKICESISYYLKGKQYKSYECIRDVMNLYNPVLTKYPAIFNPCFTGSDCGHEYMYRIRKVNHGDRIKTAEEMFHIPLNKRHLVSPHRYSLAGNPCLYLATSLYLCWEELGKPSFDSLYVSAFSFDNENITSDKILNFSEIINFSNTKTTSLTSYIDNLPDYILIKQSLYIVTWPLLFACMTPVRHNNSLFKHEYIVPQMLLQWVSDHDTFYGIKYHPSQLQQLNSTIDFSNYVFPSRTSECEGFCKGLTDKFYLTDPIHWGILEAMSADLEEFPRFPFRDVSFVDNTSTNYDNTLFGKIERVLKKNTFLNGDDIDSNFKKIHL